MTPGFTSANLDTLRRAWWHRFQPRVGQALAVGALAGILVGSGLAVRQVSLDTLILWNKYQFARGMAGAGFPSVKITWPGERGETLTPVGELLQTPGLDAWAAPVSREIGSLAKPTLLSGLLAFAVMLLGASTRAAPAERVAGPRKTPPPAIEREHSEPPAKTAPPVTLPQPIPPPVEMSSPVTLPPLTQPAPLPALAASRAAPLPSPLPVPPPSMPQIPAVPSGKPALSYETYWKLTALPFENVPDPKFYFPAPMHEEALHRLLYGVQTRKGAVMLTGEIGCGKTLLSRELSLHLAGQQYDMALIANPSFGVEDFLTEILYQLGIEPTKTKVQLLHLLNERLLDNYKKGKQTIIVVDEAQAIPDDQVFEELRLLLNFQLNDRFLVTLVLMGQPELNERVTALKQFAQRIAIKYHLGGFSQEETAQYVDFRLKAAHCQREVFTKDALTVVFQRSGGIPRNINRLCDLCLLIGSMDRATNIDRTIAERAAADLA